METKSIRSTSPSSITEEQLKELQTLLAQEGKQGRTHISKRLCELWNWRTANGRLRDITCRQYLRRLEERGIIALPDMLCSGRKVGYHNRVKLLPHPEDLFHYSFHGGLNQQPQLRIEMVRGTTKEQIYKRLIASYHYLGYNQQAGEQLKYIVYAGDAEIACIGFGASALKIKSRDDYIGWDRAIQQRNLQKIVNNNRFLILPWVQVKHLASYVLGSVLRRLRQDWWEYYRREIVLVETFVDCERFRGTCYRASNWIYVGKTQGRGRNDRDNAYARTVKDVYLYALRKNFRQELLR